FRRDHEDADAYTLTFEQIGEKIRELISIGGTQILMQGGMNDRLPIEYYEDLLRYIKTNFPTIHIHAFSPPEFVEFERFFNMDVREVIRRFRKAGLPSIRNPKSEIRNPSAPIPPSSTGPSSAKTPRSAAPRSGTRKSTASSTTPQTKTSSTAASFAPPAPMNTSACSPSHGCSSTTS